MPHRILPTYEPDVCLNECSGNLAQLPVHVARKQNLRVLFPAFNKSTGPFVTGFELPLFGTKMIGIWQIGYDICQVLIVILVRGRWALGIRPWALGK